MNGRTGWVSFFIAFMDIHGQGHIWGWNGPGAWAWVEALLGWELGTGRVFTRVSFSQFFLRCFSYQMDAVHTT
jgi:hypothetical protein